MNLDTKRTRENFVSPRKMICEMKSFLGACAAAYGKLHLFDSRCARIDECIDEKEPEKAGSSTPGSFDSRGRVSSHFFFINHNFFFFGKQAFYTCVLMYLVFDFDSIKSKSINSSVIGMSFER